MTTRRGKTIFLACTIEAKVTLFEVHPKRTQANMATKKAISSIVTKKKREHHPKDLRARYKGEKSFKKNYGGACCPKLRLGGMKCRRFNTS